MDKVNKMVAYGPIQKKAYYRRTWNSKK